MSWILRIGSLRSSSRGGSPELADGEDEEGMKGVGQDAMSAKQSVPEEAVPKKVVLEDVVPKQETSAEAAAEEMTPDQAFSASPTLSQAKPTQATTLQATTGQAAPAQTTLDEAIPDRMNSTQAVQPEPEPADEQAPSEDGIEAEISTGSAKITVEGFERYMNLLQQPRFKEYMRNLFRVMREHGVEMGSR